jgi:hypothetical protein
VLLQPLQMLGCDPLCMNTIRKTIVRRMLIHICLLAAGIQQVSVVSNVDIMRQYIIRHGQRRFSRSEFSIFGDLFNPPQANCLL